MKRRLFVGSSRKNKEVAIKIKEVLDKACSDWLDVIVWTDDSVFKLSRGTLESLVKASHEFDYGVFVAAKDDRIWKKGLFRWKTRDNVLFEAGLFMGSLGLNRAFIVSRVTLPSDLNGVTTIPYNGKLPDEASLSKLIAELDSTRQSFPLGHHQSSALAYGYYRNFLLPALLSYYEQGKPFTMRVFIPENVSELFSLIERHNNKTKSESVSLKHSLHLMKEPGDDLVFWDIPKCLRTLESFAVFYEQKTGVGKNLDWDNWLKRELENFKEALNVIIKEGQLSKNIEVLSMKV